MKIRVKDLTEKPSQVEITGAEDWLKTLYDSFTVNDAAGSPKKPGMLRAKLALTKDLAGFVQVAGQVTFDPFLDCSRCSENILWPISESIDVIFRPATGEPPAAGGGREVNLTKEDLDQYVIEEGTIDIESLLNDVVQTAIPINTVKLTEDGSACSICGLTVADDRVYGEGKPVRESPFAVLKNLKS